MRKKYFYISSDKWRVLRYVYFHFLFIVQKQKRYYLWKIFSGRFQTLESMNWNYRLQLITKSWSSTPLISASKFHENLKRRDNGLRIKKILAVLPERVNYWIVLTHFIIQNFKTLLTAVVASSKGHNGTCELNKLECNSVSALFLLLHRFELYNGWYQNFYLFLLSLACNV